jgi:hypothetical protein
MQLLDRNTDTTYFALGSQTVTTFAACRPGAEMSRRLWVILGAGILAAAGPAVLNTVEQVTLASLQLLLEIARLGLVAYQVFGT